MSPQDLLQLTDSLVARYGATGTHLLALAQRQATIEATAVVLLCAVALAVTLVAALVFAKGSYDTQDVAGPVMLIAGVLFLGALIGSSMWAIPVLLNPEWAGIRELLGR